VTVRFRRLSGIIDRNCIDAVVYCPDGGLEHKNAEFMDPEVSSSILAVLLRKN